VVEFLLCWIDYATRSWEACCIPTPFSCCPFIPPPPSTRVSVCHVILMALYLRLYFKESAYIAPQGLTENGRNFKRTVCDTSRTMYTGAQESWEIRIIKLQPAEEWSLMWCSLHKEILSDGIRSTWHIVIHGIVLTNEKLHRIRLLDTEECRQCRKQETLLHLLTEGGERQEIWECTRLRIALIQRIDPGHNTQGTTYLPLF
jgi:hypothetical protein